jgi:hypothetical protein
MKLAAGQYGVVNPALYILHHAPCRPNHVTRPPLALLMILHEMSHRLPAGVTIFLSDILQHQIIQHGIGQKLFELGVLILQRLQLPSIAHIHAAKVRLPFEKRGLANGVLAAQISHRHTAFLLAQYPDDATSPSS